MTVICSYCNAGALSQSEKQTRAVYFFVFIKFSARHSSFIPFLEWQRVCLFRLVQMLYQVVCIFIGWNAIKTVEEGAKNKKRIKEGEYCEFIYGSAGVMASTETSMVLNCKLLPCLTCHA